MSNPSDKPTLTEKQKLLSSLGEAILRKRQPEQQQQLELPNKMQKTQDS